MTRAFVILVALVVSTAAQAQRKKPTPAPKQSSQQSSQSDKGSDGGAVPKTTQVDPKTGQKSKQYDFGGLDIDGKLKTPQLLYFLNRMKSEFDTTTPDKRSFLPELKASTDDM